MPEEPTSPPDIPGFTAVRALGRGGFAEVHLYRQHRPAREVAVKVLTTTLRGDATIDAFEAEANRLAAVSSHPAVVTIFGADVSPGGHPFIVMEHCPKPNLQQRIRRARVSVPEALRIATQLYGAVETAHRAGILHRDIKPANVLFTQYDRPALADFGIANSLSGPAPTEVGLSVPWSPPEAFEGARADERLDVYGLGAMLYAMLAGRAPYHETGGKNGRREQMARIRRGDLPAIGREDVPASLVLAITRALSRDRAERQRSALELGRDLQRVQAELALEQTAMDVLDEEGETGLADEGGTRTFVRSAAVVAPLVRVEAAAYSSASPREGEISAITSKPEGPAAQRSEQGGRPDGVPVQERLRRTGGSSAHVLVVIGLVAAAAGLVLLLVAWLRDPASVVGLSAPMRSWFDGIAIDP